jgi:hypothetical protein
MDSPREEEFSSRVAHSKVDYSGQSKGIYSDSPAQAERDWDKRQVAAAGCEHLVIPGLSKNLPSPVFDAKLKSTSGVEPTLISAEGSHNLVRTNYCRVTKPEENRYCRRDLPCIVKPHLKLSCFVRWGGGVNVYCQWRAQCVTRVLRR